MNKLSIIIAALAIVSIQSSFTNDSHPCVSKLPKNSRLRYVCEENDNRGWWTKDKKIQDKCNLLNTRMSEFIENPDKLSDFLFKKDCKDIWAPALDSDVKKAVTALLENEHPWVKLTEYYDVYRTVFLDRIEQKMKNEKNPF